MTEVQNSRMPTLFVAHGGGPMPILGEPSHAPMVDFMKNGALKGVPEPKAILMISAHWEESKPTIQTQAQPSLYYDYYGFPDEAYNLDYKVPGDPALAQRVSALLQNAGFAKPREDAERGFDHGMFIPMMLMFPEAPQKRIPCVQLSLLASLDPASHIKMGKALGPLRDEGVLILGSGMSFHNMGALRRGIRTGQGEDDGLTRSKAFSDYLREAITNPDPAAREQQLVNWEKAPHARFCHPREEHLIPLHVIAGAGGGDVGKIDKEMILFGASVINASFGRS
eukprot:c9635_g1_i2.p1 GENE.c9635_g1_i2~~c9635_g1_i2.p1  ORF type:complete len:282 (-),score=47.87 c9635_g1_i2:176-1021(-)